MLTRLQELSLIARCIAADDRQAFGLLVEAYSDPLRRFVLSLTKGDVALADDLAQDTFLKAYLSIRTLNGITRFRTWLFRIAYNEFITHTRRSRPAASLDEAAQAADDDPETGATIPDSTLAEAIMRLPDTQRAIVQLFYFEEFPISRISTITGLPQGTVKSYLSRARARLALLLEKYSY